MGEGRHFAKFICKIATDNELDLLEGIRICVFFCKIMAFSSLTREKRHENGRVHIQCYYARLFKR